VLIILAFVLLLLLPSPWNLIGFIIAFVLGLCELFLWQRTVRNRPRAVDAANLIGREAVVVTACKPEGQVRLDGEIWSARSEPGASEGEVVRVVGRRRLRLLVEPVQPDAPS
jgi:membrane protein implicated in regulation of membrane protease activity